MQSDNYMEWPLYRRPGGHAIAFPTCAGICACVEQGLGEFRTPIFGSAGYAPDFNHNHNHSTNIYFTPLKTNTILQMILVCDVNEIHLHHEL